MLRVQLKKKASVSLLKSIQTCTEKWSKRVVSNRNCCSAVVLLNKATQLLWDFAPAHTKWKFTQCPNASRSAATLEGLNFTLFPQSLHSPARQECNFTFHCVSPNVLAVCQASPDGSPKLLTPWFLAVCEFRLQFLHREHEQVWFVWKSRTRCTWFCLYSSVLITLLVLWHISLQVWSPRQH